MDPIYFAVSSPLGVIFSVAPYCVYINFIASNLLTVWLTFDTHSPPSSRVTLASCQLVTNTTAVDTYLIGKYQGKVILDPNK